MLNIINKKLKKEQQLAQKSINGDNVSIDEKENNLHKISSNFNDMSLDEKKEHIGKKIKKLEDNLKNLVQDSAINKAVDSIFDLKRQLKILNSSENMFDDDYKIDVFELISLNAKQVATRRSNALIVTGQPGVGKTMTILQAIAFLNPHAILDKVIKVKDYGEEDDEENEKEVIPQTETSQKEEKKEIKLDIPSHLLKTIKKTAKNEAKKPKVIKPTVNSRNNAESGYFIASGGCTYAYLYELLYLYRDKIIVFDDFDEILKDKDCINLLKAALDTYSIRELSRMTKGNTFNPVGMTEAQIQEKYELEGKLPNQFRFTGGIIFISNLHEEKFDKALISRSLHVEVRLTRQEIIERMIYVLPDIRAEVPLDIKMKALEYLDHLTSFYKCKFELDIRQLIHTIDNYTEYPPEDPTNVRKTSTGNDVYIWQIMAKERMIQKSFDYHKKK